MHDKLKEAYSRCIWKIPVLDYKWVEKKVSKVSSYVWMKNWNPVEVGCVPYMQAQYLIRWSVPFN